MSPFNPLRTGRKPINEVAALENRQAAWDAIRTQKSEFSVRDIRDETLLRVDTVRDYLTGLTNAGYLSKNTENPRAVRYSLRKDIGREAPRVRTDGTPVTQGCKREQMWGTIWIIKQFSAHDLAVQASTEEFPVEINDAKDYCRNLAAAGYLIIRGDSYLAVGGRYTGPLSPMVQRMRQVYDPNTKTVVWKEEVHHG